MKNILLILGVTLVCALALEGLTRLIVDTGTVYELEMWKYAREVKMRDHQPDLGHRHRPNAHATLMEKDVRTNAFGFRGPAIAETAEPGAARIAFVGDSIAMGWGVAEEYTFSHQVVAMLKAQGRKVEGYNMGVGNYNTTQELALFRDVGQRLRPDVIVLVYFINDAEPMPNYAVNDWLEEHSAAWVVLTYRLDSLFRLFGYTPNWKKYYRDLYEPKAAGWIRTQQAIAGFAAQARDLGVPLIVFNVPELREFKPYPFGDVTATVRAVVEKQGLPFVDLLPTVENLEPSTLWVTAPDPHPNGKADTAFSRGMVKDLLPMLDKLCQNQKKGC